MLVLKFGGTSMGSAESINNCVFPIVQAAVTRGSRPVVVVSAMTGITNALLSLARTAIGDRIVDIQAISSIAERHETIITSIQQTVVGEQARHYAAAQLQELQDLLKALTVIGEMSAKTHDAVCAVGEKLSAKIFSCVLSSRAIASEFVDLERLIPTDLRYNSDLYWDEVEDLIALRLKDVPKGTVPVLTGFFGPTQNGILADVGRGYSDYCASLTGAALSSPEIQIWTDVDGVLSANPKVVPEAFIIRDLSFDEMAELAQFGAKVLHPFSVRPAVLAGIPIRILNTFNPDDSGTIVRPETPPSTLPFKSITAKKNVSTLRISTPRMLLVHGFIERLGAVLTKHEVSVDLIATSEISVSFSIEQSLSLRPGLVEDLQKLGQVTVEENISIISLVGKEMGRASAVPGRVFTALSREGIDVGMISFGDAKINLSLTVKDSEADKAVQTLHHEFFGSEFLAEEKSLRAIAGSKK